MYFSYLQTPKAALNGFKFSQQQLANFSEFRLYKKHKEML